MTKKLRSATRMFLVLLVSHAVFGCRFEAPFQIHNESSEISAYQVSQAFREGVYYSETDGSNGNYFYIQPGSQISVMDYYESDGVAKTGDGIEAFVPTNIVYQGRTILLGYTEFINVADWTRTHRYYPVLVNGDGTFLLIDVPETNVSSLDDINRYFLNNELEAHHYHWVGN